MYISSLLGAPSNTLVPEVNAALNGQIIFIENQPYLYQGLASITMNGFVEFDSTFQSLIGSLELTADANAEMTFSAIKQ